MGAQELTALWEIKQGIAAMPEDDRKRVNICAIAIRQIISTNPGHGQLALAWIGAEMAADNTGTEHE